MSKPLRILMLNANQEGIGTYHRALHFGRQLRRFGHLIRLITISRRELVHAKRWTDSSGMEIVAGPRLLDHLTPWRASGPLDIALRVRELLTGTWDVVYAFEYHPNVSVPIHLTRWKGYKLVSDWCDWYAGASNQFRGLKIAHMIDGAFEEHIRHIACHVTVINHVLRERALGIGIRRERVSVVREGVDAAYIHPIPMLEARKRLSLPDSAYIVGTIRDHDVGLTTLLDAVGLVAQAMPTVRLLFIGRRIPGMDEMAQARQVQERLLAPGWVSDEDLPLYLAASNVLVLPLQDTLTNRGRWPHKLGDMAAAQRPIITTDAGEFPRLLRDAGAAVIAPLSGRGIADAIMMISGEPALAAGLAENGRATAVRELDWKVIGTQLNRLLTELA